MVYDMICYDFQDYSKPSRCQENDNSSQSVTDHPPVPCMSNESLPLIQSICSRWFINDTKNLFDDYSNDTETAPTLGLENAVLAVHNDCTPLETEMALKEFLSGMRGCNVSQTCAAKFLSLLCRHVYRLCTGSSSVTLNYKKEIKPEKPLSAKEGFCLNKLALAEKSWKYAGCCLTVSDVRNDLTHQPLEVIWCICYILFNCRV